MNSMWHQKYEPARGPCEIWAVGGCDSQVLSFPKEQGELWLQGQFSLDLNINFSFVCSLFFATHPKQRTSKANVANSEFGKDLERALP